MDENRIKELAKKFLELIPKKQFFGLDELRHFLFKKIKGDTFSESEFLDVVVYLLNKGDLSSAMRKANYQKMYAPGEEIVANHQRITEVFRPAGN